MTVHQSTGSCCGRCCVRCSVAWRTVWAHCAAGSSGQHTSASLGEAGHCGVSAIATLLHVAVVRLHDSWQRLAVCVGWGWGAFWSGQQPGASRVSTGQCGLLRAVTVQYSTVQTSTEQNSGVQCGMLVGLRGPSLPPGKPSILRTSCTSACGSCGCLYGRWTRCAGEGS
jgi:hypothetical protein